jgi:hypothetical protein
MQNGFDDVVRAEIPQAVASLQTILGAVSLPFSSDWPLIAAQVLYVDGAASAWRLIETTRFAGRRQRRMLCFDSLKQVRLAIEERLAWQRADDEFVAAYMSTPGGFSGVTSDWVHSKDLDLVFRPSRDAIRRETCVTLAKCSEVLD